MASFRGLHGLLTLPLPVLSDLDCHVPELFIGEHVLVERNYFYSFLVIFGTEDWGPFPLHSLWS